MKKSIIFIEPRGGKTNVFDNYMKLPLMGSLYLGTILFNHGYQVQILNENVLAKEIDPFEINADIFCISSLTVNANRSKLLASQLKQIHPISKIFIGGIHASLLPEEFIEVADHVIIGEAEEIILDIMEDKFKEKIIQGSRTKDLENLPKVNYSLLLGIQNMKLIPIMTSRGCPFDCNFCTVTKIFGKNFRMQSPKRIVEEIENTFRYFKKQTFFIYDDNFAANKERVNEFCDILIEKKININWVAQVRSDLARDPELIAKMASAGLKLVFIGFESISDETLKILHKSQTKSDIEKAIRTFHEYGVDIHGMFMFGEDNETAENISETAEFAIENKIDTIQFMIITPFPGTQFFDQIVKENRLFHKDWDYYNGMFIVFQTKNISPVKLLNSTYQAYKRFYSLRRTILDICIIIFDIFLDALVWNFERIKRYNLDILLIRAFSKKLVTKYSDVYSTYMQYLSEIEKERVLRQKN